MDRSNSQQLEDLPDEELINSTTREQIDEEADVSEDGDDHISQDDADTQTEQSDLSDDEEEDRQPQPSQLLQRVQPPPQPEQPIGYRARDGTYWRRHKRSLPVANPLRLRNGVPKGNARQARNIRDSWNLFITAEMITDIVIHTNEKAAENRAGYRRVQEQREDATYGDVDATELLAVFGLLYLAGIHKSSHANVDELWATNGTGIEIFHLIMSRERFRFILRSLRFDDERTRNDRKVLDKLAAVRTVFDMFKTNCVNNFEPSDFMTVDEMLEAFRGQCHFRQYLPRKPARYGIKIHTCCDVKNSYIYNLEVYVGQQPPGIFRQSNRPEDIILRLVEPIANQTGRARVITTDNWYTSLNLAQELHLRNLNLLGTVRKNRTFIPKEFVAKNPRRPIHSTMFGYLDNITLLSYQAKRNRCVLCLTTVPEILHDQISGQDPQQRPEAILLYNKTKGGVDTVDKLKTTYDVTRGTRCWNLVIWFAIMNMAAINAYVVYRRNTRSTIIRSHFLKQLALDLIYNQAQRRLTVMQTLNLIKTRIEDVFPRSPDEPAPVVQGPSEGKCYLCPAVLNRKTVTQCAICTRHICQKDHTVHFCSVCSRRKGG